MNRRERLLQKMRRKNIKITFAVILILSAVYTMLIKHYFIDTPVIAKRMSFACVSGFITGILLIIPYKMIPMVIFDNHEWIPNKTIPELVEKIRLRGLLFNNISIGIFIITVFVIISGFYVLIVPQTCVAKTANYGDFITVRISATAILIFLVQILFRVFKYLLRVAAFYNAKADALEYNKIEPKYELDKIMDLFTPDKYDISDLTSPSLFDKLTGNK